MSSSPRKMFHEVDEGLEVDDLDASQRDLQVAALHQPWVGDEGPLDADFRQLAPGAELRPRGLAFDDTTTVFWDEDAVMVVRRVDYRPGEQAFSTPVLVRERFGVSPQFHRIDVLRQGALLASRYTTRKPAKRKDHA